MQELERYLIDCENKRRRMRDRPSNAVLAALRALLERIEEAETADPTAASSEPRLRESA